MTHRIVLAVLSLLVAVIGTIAIPLGTLTAAQDRRDFAQEARSTASTLANIAEERLGDRAGGKVLRHLVAHLGERGDLISVLDQAGSAVAGTASPPVVTSRQLGRARTAHAPVLLGRPGDVVIVASIRQDDGTGNVGIVVLERPTTAVEQRVTMLWLLIGGVSIAGLIAATVVALALASWVRRPLKTLEDAAQQLGDGQLSIRSPAENGPPEVRRLAQNFNLMAARLEALVHGHRATMADVSHQLRTPLAALRLRLELLAEDSDDSVAADLAGAQEEIGRLSRLVNGLLAVARAENMTTAPVNVSVDEVVMNRVAAWRPAAEEQGVVLATDSLSPGVARIRDGQLEQVVDNLLANALDALDQGGVIRIGITPAGTKIQLTIADNGPGMTAEQKRDAFRRFTTSSSGGSGLGLAIVHRLVTTSGGSVALSDTDGGGLTVAIDLPEANVNRLPRRMTGARRSTSA